MGNSCHKGLFLLLRDVQIFALSRYLAIIIWAIEGIFIIEWYEVFMGDKQKSCYQGIHRITVCDIKIPL